MYRERPVLAKQRGSIQPRQVGGPLAVACNDKLYREIAQLDYYLISEKPRIYGLKFPTAL